MKVLITGFEPFGANTTNISYEAVKLLPCKIGVADIVITELPTVFGKSSERLRQEIDEHNPDIVICVGVANSRTAITPERVAINVIDARIADNEDNQPHDEPVVEDGPAAYFSTLPIKSMVAAMNEAGLPAAVSNSAGTYVCNSTFYSLMHLMAQECPCMKGGFIHVPGNSISTEDIVHGLTIAIEKAVEVYSVHPQKEYQREYIKALRQIIMDKNSSVPQNPGYYRWWFPKDVAEQLLAPIAKSIDKSKIQKEMEGFDGKEYWLLYFGIAKDLRQRIEWHTCQKHGASTVRNGVLSTLRQTVSGLIGCDETLSEDKVNAILDQCYWDWAETKSKEESERIEEDAILNGYYPLNIQKNKAVPAQAITILKELRKKHKK